MVVLTLPVWRSRESHWSSSKVVGLSSEMYCSRPKKANYYNPFLCVLKHVHCMCAYLCVYILYISYSSGCTHTHTHTQLRSYKRMCSRTWWQLFCCCWKTLLMHFLFIGRSNEWWSMLFTQMTCFWWKLCDGASNSTISSFGETV